MSDALQAPSDQDLARQAQAGSLPAFEELVYRYERRIYSFVARGCGSAVDATEVTQQTFVKAYQALAQYDCRRPFASWLFTIARRKSIDHCRANVANAEAQAAEAVTFDDPAELLVAEEDRARFWDFVSRRLPERQFHTLWLKYVEGMDVAQIAQVMRRTRAHVKVLLFRGRRALRRELERHLPSGSTSASVTCRQSAFRFGLALWKGFS